LGNSEVAVFLIHPVVPEVLSNEKIKVFAVKLF
jgi:hypothetical protein